MKTIDSSAKFTAARILNTFIIFLLFSWIVTIITLIYRIWITKLNNSTEPTIIQSFPLEFRIIQSFPYIIGLLILIFLFNLLCKHTFTFISYTEEDILIQVLFAQKIIKFSDIDTIKYRKRINRNYNENFIFFSENKKNFELDNLLHGTDFSNKLVDFIQKLNSNTVLIVDEYYRL